MSQSTGTTQIKLAQRGLIPLLSRGPRDMAKRPKTAPIISEPSPVGFIVNKLPSFLLVKLRCPCLLFFFPFCHLPFLPQVSPLTQLHLPPSKPSWSVSLSAAVACGTSPFSLLPSANKLGNDPIKVPLGIEIELCFYSLRGLLLRSVLYLSVHTTRSIRLRCTEYV